MAFLGTIGKSKVGGGVVFTGSPNCTADDLNVVIVGSLVSSHGINEHGKSKMVTGTPTVECNDLPVCGEGSIATCGDIMLTISSVEVGL
jgi:uncharacterized Zn-binding protein involved in type VI secretion